MPRIQRNTPFLDKRGYLWIPAWLIHREPPFYVDVFVESGAPSLLLLPMITPSEHSFLLLPKPGGAFLYVAGALRHLGLTTTVENIHLIPFENGLQWRFAENPPRDYSLFPCRRSIALPLASLDARGTLTLHQATVRLLNSPLSDAASAEYDSKQNKILLHFQDQGELLVRKRGNTASLSLMGFLHSVGIALPQSTLRIEVNADRSNATLDLRLPIP